ncbi:hypothetical protein LTR94_031714, partial [Friedmanniomyces endolithicus]
TSGPRQHLNLASYRAIETGLPIARATPTGISAMIDPWGRIVDGDRLDPGVMGVIDARLPQAAGVTPYGRWGDGLFGLALLLSVALSLWPLAARIKDPHPVDRHVGRRVQEKRLGLGLSQTALGKAVGVSFQQMQKYEKGQNRISASKLFEIADFLNVGIPYFFD